jgi:hypothetical protein
MKLWIRSFMSALCLALISVSPAEIRVVSEHNSNNSGVAFKFKDMPAPSKGDAATKAKFTLVDGERDGNGGDLAQLHDGRVPTESDQPARNFFFAQGTDWRQGADRSADQDHDQTGEYLLMALQHASSAGLQIVCE